MSRLKVAGRVHDGRPEFRDTRIATMSRSNNLPEMSVAVEPPCDEVDAARVRAEKRAEDATTEQQGRFDFTGASG